MNRKFEVMDGNQAAAYVSYAFTEVVSVYPTQATISAMDRLRQFRENDVKNIFGNPIDIVELQSCAGAAGTLHGSLNSGAMTNSFVSGDGVLQMIPDMYKIAGELLPTVIHVPTSSVATHACVKEGDHSDVMACRQTGFAMICESSVQEIMDLSAVVHITSLESKVPFINFYDGYRTSHEMKKIEKWEYSELAELVNDDAVNDFRERSLNPNHPAMRGSHENGDIYFQNREASNKYYKAVPEIVEKNMELVNRKIGTDYKLFNYYGAPDADRVIIAMGSVCDTAEESVRYLNDLGEKVGLVKVRLFRPFCPEKLVEAIPDSTVKIAVLDKTKEPGSNGEPLYQDVVTALYSNGKNDIKVIGGRYGIGSKNTTADDILLIYEELKKDCPKNRFTVGICDDVTGLSLDSKLCDMHVKKNTIDVEIWGMYADGTIEANKESVNIISNNTNKYIQATFKDDGKKTGGINISYLRFGDDQIKSSYEINCADLVICQNQYIVDKELNILDDISEGGKFLINSSWTDEELLGHLNYSTKKKISEKNIRLFSIDASDIARNNGLGKKTDTILQAAFFGLSEIMNKDESIKCLKEKIVINNSDKSTDIISLNIGAIEAGLSGFHEIFVPSDWDKLTEKVDEFKEKYPLHSALINFNGDKLKVSDFVPYADGTFDTGNSKLEKRAVSSMVVSWEKSKCLQCNNCAFSCPNAALRPFMITKEEAQNAPESAKIDRVKSGRGKGFYEYTMSVSPLDCMGCGLCAGTCPAHALEMKPIETQLHQQQVFEYMSNLPEKKEIFDYTTRFSQYKAPMLEFANSCSGCAQTSYARIITQLFGEYMIVSNANGCSSRWGGPAFFSPYSKNEDGKGPAWANSHYEDNAEHGFGMYLAQKKIRDDLKTKIENLKISDNDFKEIFKQWKKTYNNGRENQKATDDLIKALGDIGGKEVEDILKEKDFLNKKSVWIFGGDGWAFDAGFSGLDHVLASGEDINIFVFDTECHSAMSGEITKASNFGYSKNPKISTKKTKSKALAEMAMTYEYVYVAQVAMGADRGHTLRAIAEAENYNGPSIVIGYAPCEAHLIKGGMKGSQREMDRAVKSGYWELFRFDPNAEGCKLSIDSKEPIKEYAQFLEGEGRYFKLKTEIPEEFKNIYEKSEKEAEIRREHQAGLLELYDEDVFELF